MPFLEPVTDDTHPVLRERGFAIETPPLLEFIEAVKRCVRVGENSLCAYGQYRCGKSTDCQWLERLLQDDGSAVVVNIQLEGRENKAPIDRWEFWELFLTAAGIDMKARSVADARQVLLHQLAVIAERANNRRIFFIVNEAQNLTIQHLWMLKQLTDELITLHFSPFVVLSGQPEIQNRVKELQTRGLGDLIDRFFTQWHRCRGLATDEIAGVLAAYDGSLVFPATSGVSYTAHFAPKLWQEGWRLANEAPALTKEFRSLYKARMHGGELKELGIKYLVAAVRWLLTGLQEQQGRGLRPLPANLIPSCVKYSGADEAWGIVGETRRVFGKTTLGVESKVVPPA